MLRTFYTKTIIFILLLILPIVIGFLLPTTPRASNSLLFSQINKDSLLITAKSPRIILVGGSNLSFGIISKMIDDSLKIKPINTGIVGTLGLYYMMDHIVPFIKKNDIIVLSPECDQFFGNLALGEEELLRTFWEIPSNANTPLSLEQIIKISNYIPSYSFSKYKLSEYVNPEYNPIYSRHSYNEYGDAIKHYKMPKQQVKAKKALVNSEINESVFIRLDEFNREIIKRGARLFIIFPALQKESFDNLKGSIIIVENKLNEEKLNILGTANESAFPDSLIFNSPYHLTKNGAEIRTKYLIQKLKPFISK